ncbi:MAG: GNAT family N-acetyltransferase [Ilumatobacteraceae bacterium]
MRRWNGTTVTLPDGDELRCVPATADRLADIRAVLGDRGGPGGCWCMFWRLTNADWRATTPTQRKSALADRLAESPPPGVLGYLDDRPVGWCAIATRVEYPRMQSSPTFGPVDDAPSWAVSCLFIHRTARRRGVGTALVEGAATMAKAYGAPTVDAIPVAPGGRRGSGDLYTGTPSMFEPLGFTEIARRKPERPIVRLTLR